MTFLPYYCPTFRTEHLREPCKTNLARVKALKAAKKHVGPLEKCVECKGKLLITRPRVEIEGLPAPESWVEKRFVGGPTPNGAVPGHDHGNFVPFVPKEPDLQQLSPEKIAKTREVVQRMAERYKKLPKQEEIAPELPKKQEETVPAVKISEKEAVKLGIVVKEVDIGPGKEIFTKQEAISRGIMPPDTTIEPRYCPTHPDRPQRIDKLGRWMGMCNECLSIRGKECGKKNVERGVTAPPMAIPLNLERYAELKAWLIEQADQNERTLQKEIMMVLKTAWRQGT